MNKLIKTETLYKFYMFDASERKGYLLADFDEIKILSEVKLPKWLTDEIPDKTMCIAKSILNRKMEDKLSELGIQAEYDRVEAKTLPTDSFWTLNRSFGE